MGKNIIKSIIALAAVLLAALSFASCSPTEESVGITGITLSETSASLKVGQTLALTATISPSNASDKTVTWSSSNTAVASVSNGTVTALSEGKATISASAGGKTASCALTVETESVEVMSISLDKTELVMDVFGFPSYSLTATFEPENATNKNVTWSSDNRKVATVDSNGKIEAISEGTAVIKATSISSSAYALCQVTVKNVMRKSLMDLYNSTDGPNWKKNDNWGSDKPITEWDGIRFDDYRQELRIVLSDKGLNGTLPESLVDIADWLISLQIAHEPNLKGTVPSSYAKLVRMEDFRLNFTGIESVPDIFADMPELNYVCLEGNLNVTGSIPESIGKNFTKMKRIIIVHNTFTGPAYGSWVKLGGKFSIRNNCLSGKIPPEFLDTEEHLRCFIDNALYQKPGYGFDITDVEIPGSEYWPEMDLEDLEGNVFNFEDVIHKNKYTVYFFWAPWCTFSMALLPRLRDYYNLYKQEGLEVVATVMLNLNNDGSGGLWHDFDGQKKVVDENGYNIWYNYYFPKYFTTFLLSTPHAEVYDQNGNILFSSLEDYPDPVRRRFSRKVSSDLFPFLESVIGPETPGEAYASTDYSKDGQVMTLQKASSGKGIDVVFMGDAYTDRDMGTGGLYETVMKDAMEEFFAIEPYKSFRNRFNVYAVKVVSRNDRIGSGYSTALESHFGNGTYVGGNNAKCEEYSLKVPGITSLDNLLTVVMVNSRNISGTANLFKDTQSGIAYVSSVGNDPQYFGPTLRHEAGGHGFAFLADEYIVYNSAAPKEFKDGYNDLYKLYGWYSNVDFTYSQTEIRWSQFLSDDRYKGETGIYEGAALYAKDAYRPSENSMMRMNIEYFNAPSRWAIYKQIMTRSGETADFNKFIEYDAVNRQSASTAAKAAPRRDWTPSAPPVVLP